MKTKIKRHSRSVISVLLAVCMLVSCMTVGIIATDAAKVTDSVAASDDSTVGDTTYYLRGNIHGTDHWDDDGWVMNNAGDGYYYYVIDMYKNDRFKFYNGTSWFGLLGLVHQATVIPLSLQIAMQYSTVIILAREPFLLAVTMANM